MKKILLVCLAVSLIVAGYTAASASGSVEEISGNAFSKVRDSPGLAVVEFYADFWPACKKLAPVMEQIASEYDGRVSFYKVNTEKNRKLSQEYGVQFIPYVLFFKNGKIVDKFIGFKDRKSIKKQIEKSI